MSDGDAAPAAFGWNRRRDVTAIAAAFEDRQIATLRARYDDGVLAAAAQVAGGDRVGPAAVSESQGRTRHGVESALAIAQEHSDCGLRRTGDVPLVGDDGQVGAAVAVQVVDGHLPGLGAGREWRARRVAKAAVTVAEKDGDCVVIEVGGDDIGKAVVDEVGCAQALVGTMAGGKEAARSRYAAHAVDEQELDLIAAPAVGGDIGFAIAVEV